MTEIKLTEDQEWAFMALIAVVTGEPLPYDLLVIDGKAGTGKTTLLGLLAKKYRNLFTVISPTGKAAQRVREHAKCSASTIHGFIYHVEEDMYTGEVTFTRKSKNDLKPDIKTVIVDEASMVSREIMEDLSRFCEETGLRLVLIGDGFQLPPVSDDKYEKFSVFSEEFEKGGRYGKVEKIVLDKIVRQAEGSPIIKASQLVRDGFVGMALTMLPVLTDEEFIAKIKMFYANPHTNPGSIICSTNKKRHTINKVVRKVLGYPEDTPIATDRFMVIHNNHELGMMNGETFVPLNFGEFKRRTVSDKLGNRQKVTFIEAKVMSDNFEESCPVYLCVDQIDGKLDDLYPNQVNKGLTTLDKDGTKGLLHCNYGYGYTAHKCQGHDFDEVVIITEGKLFNTIEERKLLYTAITRAKSKVFIGS